MNLYAVLLAFLLVPLAACEPDAPRITASEAGVILDLPSTWTDVHQQALSTPNGGGLVSLINRQSAQGVTIQRWTCDDPEARAAWGPDDARVRLVGDTVAPQSYVAIHYNDQPARLVTRTDEDGVPLQMVEVYPVTRQSCYVVRLFAPAEISLPTPNDSAPLPIVTLEESTDEFQAILNSLRLTR
ncbi:MAG: hypothetical protein AAGI71_11975 [Bacteroidota bacterium]